MRHKDKISLVRFATFVTTDMQKKWRKYEDTSTQNKCQKKKAGSNTERKKKRAGSNTEREERKREKLGRG